MGFQAGIYELRPLSALSRLRVGLPPLGSTPTRLHTHTRDWNPQRGLASREEKSGQVTTLYARTEGEAAPISSTLVRGIPRSGTGDGYALGRRRPTVRCPQLPPSMSLAPQTPRSRARAIRTAPRRPAVSESSTHGKFVAPRPVLARGDGTRSGKAAAATEPSSSASYGPDGPLRQRLWCSSSSGGTGHGSTASDRTLMGTSGMVGDASV